MVNQTIQTNALNKLMSKYSNAEIIAYFNRYATSNSFQISQKYRNSLSDRNLLVQNLVLEHIKFRDALINPNEPTNMLIIQKHFCNFWDNKIIESGQIRGPQFHISHQMFSDFGFAGNGIQYSGMSGIFFSGLIKNNAISKVVYPSELISAWPHSYREASELTAVDIHSRVMESKSYLTNDDPLNIPFVPIYHNNMPPSQKVADLLSVPNSYFRHGIKVDVKMQSSDVAVSPVNIAIPRAVYPGYVDLNEEKGLVKLLAMEAIKGNIPIYHIDPLKNNTKEKTMILNDLKHTGLIENSKHLIGFPTILTNRHND